MLLSREPETSLSPALSQAREGTLVVCPMSLLSQWHEQLALHAPGALSVLVYYNVNGKYLSTM